MNPLPQLRIHAHQQAVTTGCVDVRGAQVAFVCPIEGEAAAFQGDVDGAVCAVAMQPDAASVGDAGVTGGAGEVYGGAVSLLKALQKRGVAQTARHQSPLPLQAASVQSI